MKIALTAVVFCFLYACMSAVFLLVSARMREWDIVVGWVLNLASATGFGYYFAVRLARSAS